VQGGHVNKSICLWEGAKYLKKIMMKYRGEGT
jgi:hypothetical protein